MRSRWFVGLVEQQELRVLRQNLREERALQLAAGERQNRLPPLVLQAGERQRLLDVPGVVLLAAAEHASCIGKAPKAHDLLDCEAVADKVVLRQNADGPRAKRGLHAPYILSFKQHAARIRRPLRDGASAVDLPAPFGPAIMSHCPSETEKESASTICFVPYRTERRSTSSIGISVLLSRLIEDHHEYDRAHKARDHADGQLQRIQ